MHFKGRISPRRRVLLRCMRAVNRNLKIKFECTNHKQKIFFCCCYINNVKSHFYDAPDVQIKTIFWNNNCHLWVFIKQCVNYSWMRPLCRKVWPNILPTTTTDVIGTRLSGSPQEFLLLVPKRNNYLLRYI